MRQTISLYTQQSGQGDETNVNKMWELDLHRQNHLRHLQSIYQEKNQIKLKSQKAQEERRKQLEQYQKIKASHLHYRNKQTQDKINYQNSLLRNKLIQALTDRRKSHSLQAHKPNPYKIIQQKQMYKTNLKFGARLSNIKSEVMSQNNIEEHCRKTQVYSNILKKKSPQKQAYLKSLMKKKYRQSRSLFPEIDDPLDYIY